MELLTEPTKEMTALKFGMAIANMTEKKKEEPYNFTRTG